MRPNAIRAAALVAVAGALLAPAAAGAKVLLDTYNEGLEPHVVLQGGSSPVSNPERLRLQISAPEQTQASVHGRFTVRCSNGGKRSTRSYSVAGMAPATRVIHIPRRWSSCLVVRASARYDDPFIEGWIQIRAWAKPR